MAAGARGNQGPVNGTSNTPLRKQSSFPAPAPSPVHLRPTALVVAAAFGAVSLLAHANPDGGKVVSGQASITSNGNSLVVKNSPGAIINWQSFSIGAGQSTTFIQQSINSAVLNRVTGANPSLILGTLSSNGQVYLVNPNGVVFGRGAMVDAAGLVVSSLNITDADFKSGSMHFVGSASSGDISVAGVLRSSDGDIYLIAPNVSNSGSITAQNGNAVLAAGQDVEILGTGLTDIKFEVQNKSNQALNLGQISGDAVGLFAGTLTQAGGVNASSASVVGGRVILSALGDATLAAGSSTSADAPAGAGGTVLVESSQGALRVAEGASVSANGASGGLVTLLAERGSDSVSGRVAASGSLQLGGGVDVLGSSVALNSGAVIDASGAAGGGSVRVGGAHGSNAVMQASSTSVAAGSVIDADATASGNGGQISVYGKDTLALAGAISAEGGSAGGNGGSVETSGETVSIAGSVLAGPRHLGGKAGNWLVDPGNATIDSGAGQPGEFNATTIANSLSEGVNVTVATSSINPTGAYPNARISVNSPISISAYTGSAVLSLLAGGPIIVGTAAAITNTGTPTVGLSMQSDMDNGSTGGILVQSRINLPGGVINVSGYSFTNAAGNVIGSDSFLANVTGTGVAFNNLGQIVAPAPLNTNTIEGGTIAIRAASGSVTTGLLSVNSAGGTAGNINVTGQGIAITNTLEASGVQNGGGGAVNLTSYAGITNTSGVTVAATGGGTVGNTGGSVTLTDYGLNDAITLSGLTINVGGGVPTAGIGQDGGAGGSVAITNVSGSIALTSVGISANGSDGVTNNGAHGNGGAGGSITLTAGANGLSMTGGGLYAFGGAGDNSTLSVTGAYIPAGGGAGGQGGLINVSSSDPNLTGNLSLSSVTLDVHGGAGGRGDGYFGQSGTGSLYNTTAGYGGFGGNAGSINVYAQGTLTLNAALLSGVGGAGGAGGPVTGLDPVAVGGTGGSGGSGGLITLTTATLGQTGYALDIGLISSNVTSMGGAGGAGGSAASNLGGGGSGGAGGSTILFDSNQNVIPAVSINASGSITLSDSSVSSVGGAGGIGASTVGLETTGYSIGPGNGGAGGTAGSISLISNVTGVTAAGISIDSGTLINVFGGNGGDGGNLSGTNITSTSQPLSAGAGGVGGDAGSYSSNEALTISAINGTLTSSGTLLVLAGNGGNGGYSNDQTFGPGNGGNGGAVQDFQLYSSGAGLPVNGTAGPGITLNGVVNLSGGSGGNGGNGVNVGGTAGYAYGSGYASVDAEGGDLFLGATIYLDAGIPGTNGSTTSGPGYTQGAGSYSGEGLIALQANGQINQTAGAITAINTTFYGNTNGTPFSYTEPCLCVTTQVSAQATGNVSLTQPQNYIIDIQGEAYGDGSTFNVTSGTGQMTVESVYGSSGVTLAAPQLTVYGNVIASNGATNLSGQVIYINSSVAGAGVNLTANQWIDFAQGTEIATYNYQPINITTDSMLVDPNNVSIGFTGNGSQGGTTSLVTLTSFSERPIILTGDSYASNPSLGLNSTAGLVVASEFFTALNASALLVGDAGTPSISLSSFAGTAGSVTMPAYAQLGLTAVNISNDSYTTLSTDSLSLSGNTVILSNVQTTTPGQAMTLSGSGLNSSGATLYVSMAPNQSLAVSNTYDQVGIQQFNAIELHADTLTLDQTVLTTPGSGASITLAGASPGTALSIGGTGYTGWNISNQQLQDYISTSGTLTIGGVDSQTHVAQSGEISVVGTAQPSNVTGTVSLYTDGAITLVAGSLDVAQGQATLQSGGPITNPGSIGITANQINLISAASIGSAANPLLLSTQGSFGATSYGGNVYITGLTPLYTESQGVSAYGAVVINAPVLFNYGTISGNTVALTAASYFDNFGTVSGNTIGVTGNSILNQGLITSPGEVSIDSVSFAQTLTSTITAGSIDLIGTSGISIVGTVAASGDVNLSGGAITVQGYSGAPTIVSGDNIRIDGASLSVEGNTQPTNTYYMPRLTARPSTNGNTNTSAYSTSIDAQGTLNVTTTGDVTVTGGSLSGGSASLVSGGNSVYSVGGNINLSGGSAVNAFALLDPTNPGSTMTLTAQEINLTGGTAQGAYAAIVGAGNVVLNGSKQISLQPGTAANTDAVTVTKTGTIKSSTPDCVNCTPQTGANPLTNASTNEGFYSVAVAPPPAPAPSPAPSPAPTPAPPPPPEQLGLGDPAIDALVSDLLTLLEIPVDAQKNAPIDGLIFVDGGVDGCL